TGTQIYTDTAYTDTVNVDGVGRNFRTQSGYVPAWASWNIKFLDVSTTTPASHSGNDYIAGGPGEKMSFGEMGNHVIQGGGSIASALLLDANGLPQIGTHPSQINVDTTDPANLGITHNVTAVATPIATSHPVYAYRDANIQNFAVAPIPATGGTET